MRLNYVYLSDNMRMICSNSSWNGIFFCWFTLSTPLASLSKLKTNPIFLDIILGLIWFGFWKPQLILLACTPVGMKCTANWWINRSPIHVKTFFVFLWLCIQSMKPELHRKACSIDSSFTFATNQFNAIFYVSCSVFNVQLAKWYIV